MVVLICFQDPAGVLSGTERGLTEDDLLLSVSKTEEPLGPTLGAIRD